ncbi:hypothetical protein NKI79_19865 [Mesorhizobium sp. M0340]|uniref:hypothetical protein n=1 Tax=Mesorhizobium sp. M0340 TaxID=2956939 RepID=UPI003334C7B3
MTASTTLFLPFRKGLISLSDPGGRTENMHGLNRADRQNGFVFLSQRPPQAGYIGAVARSGDRM